MPTAEAHLARAVSRWRVTLGEPYAETYPGNLVYRCALRNGTPAVIKTEPDRDTEDDFLPGLEALLLYGGRGMVRVLEFDREELTVLLERVDPGETLWKAPIERALEAAATVMTRVRTAPPAGQAFPDVRAYHRAWSNHLRLYRGPGPIDGDLFEIGEQAVLSEIWTADDPGRAAAVDLRAARLLHEIGPLG